MIGYSRGVTGIHLGGSRVAGVGTLFSGEGVELRLDALRTLRTA